jgi:hypothetical protein
LTPLATQKIIDNQGQSVTISAIYAPNRVQISAHKTTGQDQLEVAVADPIYDNDEILMLLRTVAWQQGQESCFDGLIVDSGHKFFGWLRYLQEETIECDLGALPTWHIRLTFDTGATQELWYGIEHPHCLVKYGNNYFNLLLAGYKGPDA